LVGGKTFSINLPIQWIKDMGLEKKTNVLLTQLDNGNLLISPPTSTKKENEHELHCEIITSQSLSRDITRAYLMGFEQIEIKTNRAGGLTGNELNEIEDSISRFPGAEIMSEGKNSITIEIIASFEKNNPYKLIHRVFNLTQDMLERISNLFKLPKKLNNAEFIEEVNRIQNIDKKINRTYFLIVRQLRGLIQDARLRNGLKINTLRILDFRLISNHLENIGDYCVLICKHFLEVQNVIQPLITKDYEQFDKKEKVEIFDKIIFVSDQIKLIHQQIFDSFRNEDESMAAQIIKDTSSFPNILTQFINDLKSFPDKASLSIIMYRFYDIFDLLIDICDLITREEK
jgi:phosphate uptake regulator